MEEATNQTHHAKSEGLKGMQTLKACTESEFITVWTVHIVCFVSASIRYVFIMC